MVLEIGELANELEGIQETTSISFPVVVQLPDGKLLEASDCKWQDYDGKHTIHIVVD